MLLAFNNKQTPLMVVVTIISLIISGCSKQEKNTQDLKADELKSKIVSYISPIEGKTVLETITNERAIDNLKDPEYVMKLAENFVAQFPEDREISYFKLLLANLYLKEGKLKSAHELYKHYQDFYPSDPMAEYAMYKGILSKFYQTLKIDCDQTSTEEAIKLCDNYLQAPFYYEYKNDVMDIKNTCRQKLIDKEVYVYNFYMKKGQYKSAEKRIDYLQEKFAQDNPGLQARLLYLKCQLAHKQKKMDIAQEKLEALIDQYPKSRFTQMASALISKSKHAFF